VPDISALGLLEEEGCLLMLQRAMSPFHPVEIEAERPQLSGAVYRVRSSGWLGGPFASRLLASKRQEHDPVQELFGFSSLSNDFQVLYTSPDRDPKLMCVNDTVERDSLSLSLRRFRQQIIIAREEHPPQFAGPVE
jgi:hypothetical protein